MEILSYNSVNCGRIVKRNSIENPGLWKLKLSNGKRCGILLGWINLGSGSLRYRAICQFVSNNVNNKRNHSVLHVEKNLLTSIAKTESILKLKSVAFKYVFSYIDHLCIIYIHLLTMREY